MEDATWLASKEICRSKSETGETSSWSQGRERLVNRDGSRVSGSHEATAVDTSQHGFRPVVLCEAVGDRSPNAYEANLYDVDGKYGDVVSLEEVLKYLEEKGAAHTR